MVNKQTTATKITGRKRSVKIEVIVDHDTLSRIDLVRGPLSRTGWVGLVVQRTLGTHPAFQAPGLRRLVHDLPKLDMDDLDSCQHPVDRVHKGLCGQCGQLLIRPRWKDGMAAAQAAQVAADDGPPIP